MKQLFRLPIILIFLLALSLASGTDLSAKEKAGKPQTLDDELKLKAGDEEGNEIKSLKTELLINRNDEKALVQLNKLLKKYKGSALEASLNFRLAELYMRRAKTASFFEVHRDNSSIVRFTPQETKSASSRGWITKAVNTYDSIERRFTHYRDMDLVLFNNAFARQMIGEEKQAMQRYRRVIEDYSESPLVPDCHLAIGESLFNSKSFQAAFNEFQKIRQYPEARVYPYGLYKAAWSLYNLHRAGDGLLVLEEVVAYSKQPVAEESNGRLDLTREALDDMFVFFEDVKKPSEAVAYFRKQGGDDRVGDLVLKLGKTYLRHSRYNYLETAFLDLIEAVPMTPERPEIHKDLIDSFEITKQRSNAATHLEILSDLCQEGSKWAKLQSADVQKSCWEHLEQTGKKYASRWHRDYKKSPNMELAHLTARAYEALLKNQQKISDEDKIRFSYAELLFQEKDYRRASPQYSRVAHLTKDLKLRHDAAYAALVSLEKAVGDKWSDSDERVFATLAQDYITLNPKGQFVTDVKFKKAFIAYDKGRYDEASPLLRDLALSFSSSERGRKAAHLYLDILNIQKKYELLRDESFAFSHKLSLDAQSKAEFMKIYQQAAFIVIQGWETQGRYQEAVKGYISFVNADPQSNLADKALYNAVRCANLSGDLLQASRLAERVLKDYPQSTYKLELARALVTLYEAQAQLGLAGQMLLKLADWETEKHWAYLLNGADYKALNNEWKSAVQIYQQLTMKAPSKPEGKIALERLAVYNEKNDKWVNAYQILEQIIDLHIQPQASLAMFKITQHAYTVEKDNGRAFKYAKQVIAMKNESKVSAYALGQARLIQGKILETEFDAVSVKAKPERLSYVLQIKTEKLDHVQKAYQDAIGFGDRATAVEALVRLAKSYDKFSKALHSIEAPREATDADKKKFYEELENMAMPIEEKNAETLQIALKQARDIKLHDGSIAQIQMELNRLARRAVSSHMVVDLSTPENVLPMVN
jgi:tetratricopeptide (TPR) repeat protein